MLSFLVRSFGIFGAYLGRYIQTLDSKVSNDFFDVLSTSWREEPWCLRYGTDILTVLDMLRVFLSHVMAKQIWYVGPTHLVTNISVDAGVAGLQALELVQVVDW